MAPATGRTALPPLSGVVLAGGASRRMGRDKALLEFRGQRLVERALDVLGRCADDLVVASGDRPIPDLAVPQVRDAVERVGPLGGLVAGLAAARHELVAVLAVDLPWASDELLRALAARWAGEAAVVPAAGGRPQPLHALWSRAAAGPLRARIQGGTRSVLAALDGLAATVIDAETLVDPGHARRFAVNWNRPQDLP